MLTCPAPFRDECGDAISVPSGSLNVLRFRPEFPRNHGQPGRALPHHLAQVAEHAQDLEPPERRRDGVHPDRQRVLVPHVGRQLAAVDDHRRVQHEHREEDHVDRHPDHRAVELPEEGGDQPALAASPLLRVDIQIAGPLGARAVLVGRVARPEPVRGQVVVLPRVFVAVAGGV